MAVKFSILILLVLLGLSVFAPVRQACASSTIAPQTCDTQVWQTMDARARLETEREIMQNQNLIYKADSILNYTCFDNFAAHAAANVGVLFTHTTYFGPTEIIPWGAPNGIDDAMQKVVIDSMRPYITENFRHEYLGGRGREVGLDSGNAQNIGSKGRAYSCDVMNKAWIAAKCMNFLHTNEFKATDGFYPFADLAAMTGGTDVAGYQTVKETRQYPTPCSGGTPITGSTWEQLYSWSKNDANKYYPYQEPTNRAFTEIRDMVKPGSCGAAATAIKTGVKVILSPGSTSTYDDGVCTNPGCTYNKDGVCQGASSISGGGEG